MATSRPLPPWFLTGKRSVWCFLFVTLFNLQGARLIGGTLLIIHYFFSFVKNFFQSFLTPDPFCIVSNFLSLPHSISFVKNFFQKVLNFRFLLISGNFYMLPYSRRFVKNFLPEVSWLGAPLVSGNFLSLPHLVVAVKCFFDTLWHGSCRADSFVRIPNLPSFVNPLFTFF